MKDTLLFLDRGSAQRVDTKDEVKAENSDKEKEEGYDCEEDGVNYLHRKASWGNYTSPGAGETNTWQECQKKCAENKHCKFFTWHKEESHWKKDCAIFDTFAWKDGGFLTVSGPRECLKSKSK